MTITTLIVLAALSAWLYLIFARGLFWMARERDDRDLPATGPSTWPSVVAVIPARNEADVIPRTLASLLAQDYPGAFRIVLVDDNSTDGTGEAARALDRRGRSSVITGAPPAAGWTGKLWAVRQGIEAAARTSPDYFLLTDADIWHAPDNLRCLARRAEAGGLVLTSLMARLAVESWAERLLIPAFVFFFDMLYPFAWVNDPRRSTAAAAGGCMLVNSAALEAAGGIEAISGAIIDDCALAKQMKAQGPIWLGLTDRARSLRPYAGLGEIGRMVSRSAYAQLGYSPWLLAATILGMGLVYLAAPLLAMFGAGTVRWAGLATWAAMALAYQPMLSFYRRSPAWGLALPAVGAIYAYFTLQSAIDVWQGRGGMWKGRAQALVATR
jgi:hopene-associated glycosyltransferase HpnB